jgi:acetyl esterase/lipase
MALFAGLIVRFLSRAFLFVCVAFFAVNAQALDVPRGGKVYRDVAYGAAERQVLDIYAPPKVKGAPIILMVHGGAWMYGDKTLPQAIDNKGAHYLAKGYLFASMNYRFVPEIDAIEQAREVGRALAYLQANAKTYGGDGARIILMGHSAGAHLIALLASDKGLIADSGAAPWLGTVSLDSGAYDVTEIMEREHEGFYDAVFGAKPAFWRAASPFYRLNTKPGPMLLVCSSLRATACPQAKAFQAKLATQKTKATVLPIPLTHRGINDRLGQSGGYTKAVDKFLKGLGLP